MTGGEEESGQRGAGDWGGLADGQSDGEGGGNLTAPVGGATSTATGGSNATSNTTFAAAAGNGTSPSGTANGTATAPAANGTTPSNLTMEAPILAPGDLWRYSSSAPYYNATIDVEVTARKPYWSYEAYEQKSITVLPGMGVSMKTETTSLDRVSDLARLKSESKTSVDTPYGDRESSSSTVYDPPCIVVKWPLFNGSSWQSTCTSTMSKDGSDANQTSESQSYVVAIETVDVPAGSFQTFKVTTLIGSRVRHDYYAEAACGIVKSVIPGQNGDLVNELQYYSCNSTS